MKQYPLEAAVWENRSPDGDVYYSVSLNRTYTVTNENTGEKEYRTTGQLRAQDLLLGAELLRSAFHKVRSLEGKD